MKGLSVGNVVNIGVSLAPRAAPRANFGVLMVLGDSSTISTQERVRMYTGIDGVATDFGMDAPEYKAAENYFSQSPRPARVIIGRWANDNTPARLTGAVLTTVEQDVSAWNVITNGGFKVSIDGVSTEVTGLDFSGETNLNGIASAIQTKLGLSATFAYDGSRFIMETASSGPVSSLTYLSDSTEVADVDISGMLKMSQGIALPPVSGSAGETPVEAVNAASDVSSDWYGVMFASTQTLTSSEVIDIAKYIEASERPRLFGYTEQDTRALDMVYTDDTGSKLKILNLNRSFWQYSSTDPYAVASFFGRAFTVDFAGSNTVITMKFKVQPGVGYEMLTETQAAALAHKNGNVFVLYNNDTAIIQEGVMSSGIFFDEMHNLDWLANAIQTEMWNRLRSSATKIPQTEDGVGILVAVAKGVCEEGVRNGMIARNLPWNADGFGVVKYGDVLTAGYYIYTVPLREQAQSEREQRKAPFMQIAVKLAGAVHSVNAMIYANK